MARVFLNDDQRKIVEAFDNLMPWEKGELIKHIIEHEMTEDEIEKYFIEGTGYVKYDDIDFVKEVVDNHLEYDVLDEFFIDYICDYIIENSDASDAVEYIIKHADSEDVANGISSLSSDHILEIFKALWHNNRDFCIKILDNITK